MKDIVIALTAYPVVTAIIMIVVVSITLGSTGVVFSKFSMAWDGTRRSVLLFFLGLVVAGMIGARLGELGGQLLWPYTYTLKSFFVVPVKRIFVVMVVCLPLGLSIGIWLYLFLWASNGEKPDA